MGGLGSTGVQIWSLATSSLADSSAEKETKALRGERRCAAQSQCRGAPPRSPGSACVLGGHTAPGCILQPCSLRPALHPSPSRCPARPYLASTLGQAQMTCMPRRASRDLPPSGARRPRWPWASGWAVPVGLECTGVEGGGEAPRGWGAGARLPGGVWVRETGGSQPGGSGVSGNSMFKARGRDLAIPGMTQAGRGVGRARGRCLWGVLVRNRLGLVPGCSRAQWPLSLGDGGALRGRQGLQWASTPSGSLELAAPGHAGKLDPCGSRGSQAVPAQAQNKRCSSQACQRLLAWGPGLEQGLSSTGSAGCFPSEDTEGGLGGPAGGHRAGGLPAQIRRGLRLGWGKI